MTWGDFLRLCTEDVEKREDDCYLAYSLSFSVLYDVIIVNYSDDARFGCTP